MKYFALLTLALLCFIHSGQSLKCYKCDSSKDKNCASSVSKDYQKDCSEKSAGSSFSSKLTPDVKADTKLFCATVNYESGDTKTVWRDCLTQELKDKCKKDGSIGQDAVKKIVDCKTCESDNCNGSNSLSIAMSALLLPLIASLVVMK